MQTLYIPLGLLLPVVVWVVAGLFHKKPIGRRLWVFFFLWGWAAICPVLEGGSAGDELSRYVGQGKYWIKGVAGVSRKSAGIRRSFDFSLTSLGRDPENLKPVKGKLRLSVYGGGKEIFPGDTLFFKGPIYKYHNFQNPGGFDYVRYLALQGISAKSWVSSKGLIVIPWQGDPRQGKFSRITFVRVLESLRKTFGEHVKKHVKNQKAGAVLMALVTGQREGISQKMRDVFSCTGTSHLLAISGLHLAMVGGLFFFIVRWFLLFFSRIAVRGWAAKGAALATLLPLFLYAELTGFSPATRRAFIMISCLMLAHVADREADPLNSLAGAAFLILVMEPGAVFSISFQLSFTAVLFIVMGLRIPGIALFFQNPGFRYRILLFVFISLCAIMGTQPLVMTYFNTISFVGLVTNLFMVPVIGWLVLPLGIVSLICFLFFPFVSSFLIQICCWILAFFLPLLEEITHFSWTWTRTVTPHWPDLIGWYSFYAGLWLWAVGKKFRGVLVITLAVSLTGLYEAELFKKRHWNQSMSAMVLDVGQGSAALLELPLGRRVLIDGGGFSGGTFDTGRNLIAPLLWRRRIMTLDAVILSHPQADHIKGLVYILENFTVGRLVKNMDMADLPAYHRLMELAEQKKIPVSCVPSTSVLTWPMVCLEFLYPLAGMAKDEDLNNNSVVVKVTCHNTSLLFPGDIMARSEVKLAKFHQKKLYSQVLVAPHHGSNTSSTDFFLDLVRPESVIISCGVGNRFGFPRKSVLERYKKRGISFFRTDLDGAVEVIIRKGSYSIGPVKGD